MNYFLIWTLIFISSWAYSQEENKWNAYKLNSSIYKIYANRQVLKFSWDKHEDAKIYLFQMSRDPYLQDIIVSRKTKYPFTKLSLSDKFLAVPGQYYWRVIAVPKDSKALVSEVRTFIVGEGGDFKKQKSNFSSSVFYSASVGKLEEKTKDETSLSFIQNSSATLGLFLLYNNGSGFSTSSSLYFSYYAPTEIESDNSSLDIPPEFGLNTYLEKSFSNHVSIYGGWDFENFYTYNIAELENNIDSEYDVNQQQLQYFTLGFSFFTYLDDKLLMLKLSSSKSFYNSGVENEATGTKLEGYKSIVFLSQQITQKLSLQAFYKLHQLSNANEVSINRYGAGISYRF